MSQRATLTTPQRAESASDAHNMAALPPPTIWPSALALGIALSAGGLVMSPLVVAGGILLVILAIVGWVRDLMRDATTPGSAAAPDPEVSHVRPD